jgi:hypothetical protein
MIRMSGWGEGIYIRRYTGKNEVVVYPAEIEGYPVLFIVNATEKNSIIPEGVKGVSNGKNCVLPSTLEYLYGINGNTDFSKCVNLRILDGTAEGFTSIDLSHTKLTFLGRAFFSSVYNDNLQSVKLPDSLEIISASTFSNRRKLTDVNIPANIKQIGEWDDDYTVGAFSNCYELYNLEIPDSITAININRYTFSGCGKLPLATRKRLQDLGYKGSF